MATIAQRPADDGHPFGHGQAEFFSSGFEGLSIGGAAGGIVRAAVHRFAEPQPLQSLGWGLALSVESAAPNGALALKLMAAAREQRSIGLEAAARHLHTRRAGQRRFLDVEAHFDDERDPL